jgi:hypothetical protein
MASMELRLLGPFEMVLDDVRGVLRAGADLVVRAGPGVG